MNFKKQLSSYKLKNSLEILIFPVWRIFSINLSQAFLIDFGTIAVHFSFSLHNDWYISSNCKTIGITDHKKLQIFSFCLAVVNCNANFALSEISSSILLCGKTLISFLCCLLEMGINRWYTNRWYSNRWYTNRWYSSRSYTNSLNYKILYVSSIFCSQHPTSQPKPKKTKKITPKKIS